MSADDETQVLPAVTNGNGDGGDDGEGLASVFAKLRDMRAEHAVEQTYDIEVPGYGGLLFLRCGPISGPTLATLRGRMMRSKTPDRDVDLAIDVLVAACREVMVRLNVDDELQPADEDEPMRVDERLAVSLGLTGRSAREVMRELYSSVPSPELAIVAESNAYYEWASAANDEIDSTFLGESEAARR